MFQPLHHSSGNFLQCLFEWLGKVFLFVRLPLSAFSAFTVLISKDAERVKRKWYKTSSVFFLLIFCSRVKLQSSSSSEPSVSSVVLSPWLASVPICNTQKNTNHSHVANKINSFFMFPAAGRARLCVCFLLKKHIGALCSPSLYIHSARPLSVFTHPINGWKRLRARSDALHNSLPAFAGRGREFTAGNWFDSDLRTSASIHRDLNFSRRASNLIDTGVCALCNANGQYFCITNLLKISKKRGFHLSMHAKFN
jgi:hypothetical protein